jgi:ketosteroid isomerase-like protein
MILSPVIMGKFFGKKGLEGIKPGQTADTEASDMKSLQSGNLAIVTGIMTYHHKQPDGTDLTDKNVFTFGLVKKGGKWMYATHHASSMVEEKPEDVLNLFLTEYHKNPKAFFESRLPQDFRFLNGGKQTVTKEGVLSDSKTDPTDSEVTDVKAFKSGNLGIVSGVHVFKNRQSDGNIRADKVYFTYTMVKRNGKWFFAESHQTPVKE